MAQPSIDPLPQPPNRANPVNYSQLMDAFLAALPVWAAQANAVGLQATADGATASKAATAAVNAPGTSATSATSLAVGLGAKTLTVQAGKNFVPGMWVTVARTSAPTTYMCGPITAYDATAGTLTINAQIAAGTGTFTDWTASLSPPIAFPSAAASDIWAGISTALGMTPAAMLAAGVEQPLADAATITPDFSTGAVFAVTISGNRTLANPVNTKPGQSGMIFVSQDSTGGWKLTFGTAWKFPGGTPTLSSAAGAEDCISWYARKDGTLRCTVARAFA